MRKNLRKKEVQPEGNFYNKYNSENPIEIKLMHGYFAALENLLNQTEMNYRGGILEAGCGEGNITNYIWNKYGDVSIEGFDLSEKVICEAKQNYPNINFFQHDIYKPVKNKKYDLVVCCEVLEHLESPEKAVKNLMEHSNQFIFSVPNEPIWRMLNIMRGKYVKDFGNTPGHIQHFSQSSLRKFLIDCGLGCIEWEKPLPWLMVRCGKKN